jgi:hypothetical protein
MSNQDALDQLSEILLTPEFEENGCLVICGKDVSDQDDNNEVEMGFFVKAADPYYDENKETGLRFNVTPFFHTGNGNNLEKGEEEILLIKNGENQIENKIISENMMITKMKLAYPDEEPMKFDFTAEILVDGDTTPEILVDGDTTLDD